MSEDEVGLFIETQCTMTMSHICAIRYNYTRMQVRYCATLTIGGGVYAALRSVRQSVLLFLTTFYRASAKT